MSKKMVSFRFDRHTLDEIDYLKSRLKYDISTTELLELIISYSFQDFRQMELFNFFSEIDIPQHFKKDKWI